MCAFFIKTNKNLQMHILILLQFIVLNSFFFLHSSPTHLEGGEILRSSGGEKLSCITTTRCSTYFIGGSVSGAIYIWLVGAHLLKEDSSISDKHWSTHEFMGRTLQEGYFRFLCLISSNYSHLQKFVLRTMIRFF